MTYTPALDAPTTTDQLASHVVGPVFEAGDPGLPGETDPWNLSAQHHPDVVVGAASSADVAAAVSFAVEHGLPVAVQATGHGNVEPCTKGVLVTTWRMQDLVIDPATATARVGAGVKWKTVVEAAAPHGLAPLSGSSTDVGVIGYTLGGGLGSLGRKHGFAADLVRSLEVVTADGRLRHVDATHHADLFWALRGGKGNFGIVTAMEFDLVPVADLYGGGLFFDGTHAAAVLHAWREWAPGLSEDTSTSFAVLRLPEAPDVPPPLQNRVSVHIRFCHQGTAVEAERLLAPIRAAAPVLLDDVRVMSYTTADDIHRDPVDPMPVWEKGMSLSSLPAEAVDALLTQVGPGADVPLFCVEVRQLGGALARPAAVPNAVPGRESAYSVLILGPYPPELSEAVPAAGQAVLDALVPYRAATCLVNFIGHATPAEIEAAWGPEIGPRLRSLKSQWDPENRFRRGHALAPA